MQDREQITFPGLTQTQQKIFNVLADGHTHELRELQACLKDPLSRTSTILVHLTHMRRKLNHRGLEIVCVLRGGKRLYRMIRPLYPPE